MQTPTPTTILAIAAIANLTVAAIAIRRARQNAGRASRTERLIAQLRWQHMVEASNELRRQVRRERSVIDRLLDSPAPCMTGIEPRAAAAAGEPFPFAQGGYVGPVREYVTRDDLVLTAEAAEALRTNIRNGNAR